MERVRLSKPCADCGRTFKPTGPAHKRCAKCSAERTKLLASQRKQTWQERYGLIEAVRVCTECEKRFQPRTYQQQYCGTRCHGMAKRRREREARVMQAGGPWKCRGCDQFTVWRKGHLFCSRDCERSYDPDAIVKKHETTKRAAQNRATYRAATLAEAERVRDYYDAPGRAEARENALTGFAPASVFHGIRKGV